MTPEFVFILQSALIFVMYLGMRRHWLPTRVIVIGGVIGSAILMSLRLLTTPGADPGLSLMLGLPLGAVIGLAVAAIAWYFVIQERRSESKQ